MAVEEDQSINNLVDLFPTQLKLFIKGKQSKEFRHAIRKDVIDYFKPSFDQLRYGIINIAGKNKTGKTTIAHKLAYLLKERGYNVQVTFDYYGGIYQIKPQSVLIVESGNILTEGKDDTDSYGLEQYYNYANQKESIVIVLSTKRLDDSYTDISLETVGLTKNGNNEVVTRTLWFEGSLPIGYVDFTPLQDEDFQEELWQMSDMARLEYNRTDLDRLLENLDKSTKKLMKQVFPKREVLEGKPLKDIDDNAIEPLKALILGDVNSGKSSLAKILHARADSQYPTYARRHANDLGLLYNQGWSNDKRYFCQMLFVEDGTYNLDNSPKIADQHIRFRHLMNEATGGTEEDRTTGRQTGLACVIIALHRLTGDACPIRFRNSFDWQFLLELPTLKWDRDYFRGMLGSDLSYDFLVWLNSQRLQAKASGDIAYFNELMGMGVAVGKDNESIPFQLHTSLWDTKSFTKMKGSSKWSENWVQIAKKVRDIIIKNGWNPTNPIMESLINKSELDLFGYIRLASEGRINYRTVVKNEIKAFFDIMKAEQGEHSTYPKYVKTEQGTKDTAIKGNGEWKFKKIKVAGNTEYIYDSLIEMVAKDNLDNPFFVAYKLWNQGESQTSPAIKKVLKQAGLPKMPDQSYISREFGKISTQLGYAFENYLLLQLGNQLWKVGGGNDSAPDLYSDETAQTISVKYRRNAKFSPTSSGHKKGRERIISAGEREKYESGHQLWVLLFEAEKMELKLWSVGYDVEEIASRGIPYWFDKLLKKG